MTERIEEDYRALKRETVRQKAVMKDALDRVAKMIEEANGD